MFLAPALVVAALCAGATVGWNAWLAPKRSVSSAMPQISSVVSAEGVGRAPRQPRPDPLLSASMGLAEARLEERALWLERDLRRMPEHPVLLAATAETYLRLAYHRSGGDRSSSDPAVRQWRGRAEACIARLRRLLPTAAAPLEAAAHDPGGVFGGIGVLSLLRLSTTLPQDAAFRLLAGMEGSAEAIQNTPYVSIHPPAVRPPRSLPSGSIPGAPPPVDPPPGSSSGNVPAAPFGLGPGSLGMGNVPLRVVTTETPVTDARLALLRARVRAAPEDSGRVEEMLRALLIRGRQEARRAALLPEDRWELERPWVLEAARVCAEAAERIPLRVYRAAYYREAAAAFGRARDFEREYRMLRRAVRDAPYVAALWRELRVACVRTGRLRESQLAWNEARRTLPEVSR